jgi:hypothetical protein
MLRSRMNERASNQSSTATFAVVRTAEDLRTMFRERIARLGISYETVDKIAGLPDRYTSKLLAPHPLKRFGPIAIEAMLGACGIKLLAIEDEEAMARIAGRFVARRRSLSLKRAGPSDVVVSRDRSFMQRIGQFGGFASAQKRNARALQKKTVSEVNRRAALRRWRPQETRRCTH